MLKKYILIWLTIISSVIFIIRLASLQLSSDSYFNSDFAIQELSVYPERGLIFDRNGNLLVANQPSYELIIIPENTPEFDTISFSNLINIDPNNLKNEINSAIAYSTKLPSVIKSQISKEENAFLQEKIWQYKGFYLRKNSVRDYVKPYASNVIGYTGEVDKSDISNNSYYVLKNTKKSALIYHDSDEGNICRIEKTSVSGITPRNAEQAFAIHSLLNEKIPLVSINGVAGTGKTLLAVAAAISQRRNYKQIFVARPIVPLGNKDIGYLPGDISSKINPYMEPLWDNFKYIQIWQLIKK